MNIVDAIVALENLGLVLEDVGVGVLSEDTIPAAADVLADLGGHGQAGQRLDLFLQALANGNPDNLDAVHDRALKCLMTQLPEETP